MIAALGLLLPTALLYWGLIVANRDGDVPLRALALGIAMGLAAGVVGSAWFFAQVLLGASLAGALGLEAVLLLALAWWLSRTALVPALSRVASAPLRFAPPVLVLLAVTWLVSMLVDWWLHPHGSWDAVSIWNLHARYLVAGGERWGALCRDGLACAHHADYPPLLSACVAYLWSLSGDTNPALPGFVGAWFSLATVLLCGGAVAALRGVDQGMLAAAALLGGSFFVRQSGGQYADVPLAFFMTLAAVACVVADAGARRSAVWLFVAGLCAGFAALTKNEGLPFALILVALRGAMSWRRVGWSATRHAALPLGLGLVVPLGLLLIFKLAFAPPNDLVAGQGFAVTLARLVDSGRYVTTFGGLAAAIVRVGKATLLALLVDYLLLGATTAAAPRAAARFVAALFAAVLVGYFFVFVLTPQPLAWHLQTSAARLILQIWPGALLAAFLFLATPGERLR